MNFEYVKLNADERIYGVKNLLQSQISVLNLLKHAREFEILRKKELTLKVELKSRLDEVFHSISNLNSGLPKIQIKREEKEDDDLFSEFQKEHDSKKRTIDQELDEIKRKLQLLS